MNSDTDSDSDSNRISGIAHGGKTLARIPQFTQHQPLSAQLPAPVACDDVIQHGDSR